MADGQLNTYAAMKLLTEAGEAGLTTSQIAVQFTVPVRYQARSNRVSQIMRQMQKQGFAYPGKQEFTSVDVRRMLVRRWFATTEGAAYVERGPNDNTTRAERRAAKTREWQHLAALAAEQRREALIEARTAIAVRRTARGLTKCWRYDKIIELRQIPCTLEEIAGVFGITRERVRQIEAGRENPCECFTCRNTPLAGRQS